MYLSFFLSFSLLVSIKNDRTFLLYLKFESGEGERNPKPMWSEGERVRKMIHHLVESERGGENSDKHETDDESGTGRQ